MEMRRPARAVVLVVGLLPVAACGDAEGAFRSRERLTSCGSHGVDYVKGVPADAAACLLDAAKERRGAELALTHSTVEGEPIVIYYRARPGKPGFEIFKDATKDRYASVEWAHEICETLKVEERQLVTSGCREAS